ncbi:hypothetical protein CPC08DRAFT_708273 [Agrocybe pediades]|nr:hypothetical protein CPC08DRAFT_708273 [Agrocybe pediades]
MSLSTLSSLELNFTSTPPADESPENCLLLIHTKGGNKTLRSIRLAGDDLRSVVDRCDALNHLDTYGPQLENIDVEVYSACHEDLPDMCDRVFSPNLKSFKYASIAADDDPNRQPRLSDLQVVPGKMINVKVLHVPVSLNMDEEAVKLLQNAVKGERKCHGLEEIILRPLVSDLRDYVAPAVVYPPKKFTALTALTVGKYLNYLFPHLKSVDMSRFSKIDEAWRKAVEDVVMTLQRERQHIDDRGLCCKTCTNFPGQLRV